jgi:hypothetical protein
MGENEANYKGQIFVKGYQRTDNLNKLFYCLRFVCRKSLRAELS